MKRKSEFCIYLFSCFLFAFSQVGIDCYGQSKTRSTLEKCFDNPPHESFPGVYWYFMDGNISKEGMTKDLESMKKAGLEHLIYLEVNVGIPRGNVNFLSDEWVGLFKHAVHEAERLGIDITLGVGPGWTGSGGPWVQPNQSMQHLVSSSIEVNGGQRVKIHLDTPLPRKPYFGEHTLTPDLKKQWLEFYEDVAVIAFPSVDGKGIIQDIDEKSLVYRAPYSSARNVKQFLPMFADYPKLDTSSVVSSDKIIDLTAYMDHEGMLEWQAPEGKWTIVRFGRRNNGAVTRPAPLPGLGFEVDKFDTLALRSHLDAFTGKLFHELGLSQKKGNKGGLKMLHMDSWEMGAQNWSENFRKEFLKRRGYDPFPFYPVYAGFIVDGCETSERFLWDLRKTSQELILENHAGYLKDYAHKYKLGLSIEPYDMNPSADLELGAVADVPMCEFWSAEFGYNTSFSAVEGTSLAHLKGQNIVPAEAFTAQGDRYAQYPGRMKNQTDWAFAAGINRLMFHTFQHQPLDDNLRPGMTMGPYGVHWDRNQTWWPMVKEYHMYVARCQAMLQMGRTVADILYLCPEGAPHVFRAPASAFEGDLPQMQDKKGHNFDACPPSMLYQAVVNGHRIIFPSGASYSLLVLPDFETMTPELLRKIKDLLSEGAIVVGFPPKKSPSLENYPYCDKEITQLVQDIWGGYTLPEQQVMKKVGKGKIIWGKPIKDKIDNLYPHYDLTSSVLSDMGVGDDFCSDASLRYTHRVMEDCDIYFVSNRSNIPAVADCYFRVEGKMPELWHPLTGNKRDLPEYNVVDGRTKIKLRFDGYESYFIVFRKKGKNTGKGINFREKEIVKVLNAPWRVSFDSQWGGISKTTFTQLIDWSSALDPRIKYYSGNTFYEQTFEWNSSVDNKLYLDLGDVRHFAKVWLNGKELKTLWTSPWVVDISKDIKKGVNQLKIEVVNLWVNRLIGDAFLPDDGIVSGKWPDWMLNKQTRTGNRYTFTTYNHYSKNDTLDKSGLLGPVVILEEKR